MDGAGGEGDAAANLSLKTEAWDLTSLDGRMEKEELETMDQSSSYLSKLENKNLHLLLLK